MSGCEPSAERQAVNLARAAPFRIGALLVTPATRQIVRDGKTETLEPRVMQVLVALKQAEGGVVTRDDLIARCWDGRIVGDNAIQRTISRLREVAATLGEGCFRLDTVNKVGYRLIALDAPPREQDAQPPPPARRSRVPIYAAIGIAGVAADVALAIWLRPSGPAVTRVTVVGAQGSGSADLANGVAVDLARLAGARRNAIAFATGPDEGPHDYVLRVSERGRSDADVSLANNGSSDLVWSAAFAKAGGNLATLRGQIANSASRVIAYALQANSDPTFSEDDFLRLLFSACERLDDDPSEAEMMLWRRILAVHPDNPRALATLAYIEASLSADYDVGVDQKAPWRAAAADHLRKARISDAHLGLTYAAEAMLLPLQQYAQKLAPVDRGLAADPDCAALYALRSDYLHSVGLMDDALSNARRAVALAPDSTAARETLISTLAYGGFAQAAKSELEAAERIWPDARDLKDARFRFDYRFGDAASLIGDIDRGNALPNNLWFMAHGPERAFLLARAQPTPLNIDNAAAQALKYGNQPFQALQNLVALGRIDEAYAFMRDPRTIAKIETDTEILFRANMLPFLLDRRFMALADRLGLLPYWLASHAWPDFCRDKDLPYDCKAEAHRLHPSPA